MPGPLTTYVKSTKKKTLHINDFLMEYEYPKLVQEIEALVSDGTLSPRGKRNGMNPSIYHSYQINRRTDEALLSEIRSFPAHFDNKYYLKNPKHYLEDKPWIDLVAKYFVNQKQLLAEPASINERAYQIVGDEKWLCDDNGFQLLSRLGISLDALNVFPTPEPFAYFQYKEPIENVLISENKDAFHDIRKVAGGRLSEFMGVRVDLLVWGSGNEIQKSFAFLRELKVIESPTVHYWGDLDYAGLAIFTKLCANYPEYKIIPMMSAYQMMRRITPNPPKQKTSIARIDRNIETFLRHFAEADRSEITHILESGHRIPQESIPYEHISRLVM